MKKLTLLIALIASFGLSTLTAQESFLKRQPTNFAKGVQNLHVGIGFPAIIGEGSTQIPPVHVSYERGITDHISVGGYLGYTSTKSRTDFLDGELVAKYSYVIIGARGSYHVQLVDKLDTYGGLMLGYNIASGKVTATDDVFSGTLGSAAAGGVALAAHIGANYMFNEKMGAFAEIGYGVAALNVGLNVKF